MSTIIKGDKVRVKVSAEEMKTPWDETGVESGTYVETAYKLENKTSRDSVDTTVFMDAFKTKTFLKKDISLTLTCRQASNDAGQDLIKKFEDENTDFYIAFTKNYEQGEWVMYKVACESYDENLEVSNVTDSTFTLALAPGSTKIVLQKTDTPS